MYQSIGQGTPFTLINNNTLDVILIVSRYWAEIRTHHLSNKVMINLIVNLGISELSFDFKFCIIIPKTVVQNVESVSTT